MATTTEITKQEYTYIPSGFNPLGFKNITYEILIKEKLSDDLETFWYNAYVKLVGDPKPIYSHESFRNKNIIGTDTSDLSSKSEDIQMKVVMERIIGIIKEHHG